MTKKEIIQKLDDLGIEYKSTDKKAVLEALLPEEKPVLDTATENNEVRVVWQGNARVYSKEVHGENYKDSAKQFANKVGGNLL